MKKCIYILVSMLLLSSCHIYRNYQRPEGLPVDSLYRNTPLASDDSLTLGDIPWQEMFEDPLLQNLIQEGLENNIDMQVALCALIRPARSCRQPDCLFCRLFPCLLKEP